MIKVLPKNVADKIAAGEVIERPYSVAKELVENAVDAGADVITCEIRGGGKTFLRVTDNGRGIPDEETETAFLRHATSKIESVSDLTSITSLGFRGEALASIAAVSRVSLITKVSGSRTGTRLTIHGGEIIEHAQVGCPDGTTFLVTDLFYNTPARREFLKSDHAESSPIIEFMSQMAIAYTNIRFQLINNGKTVFTSRGDGNLKNTILSVCKGIEPFNTFRFILCNFVYCFICKDLTFFITKCFFHYPLWCIINSFKC
jgi:DNA mismatch repair protein MutL